jgi:hypothetical protein
MDDYPQHKTSGFDPAHKNNRHNRNMLVLAAL